MPVRVRSRRPAAVLTILALLAAGLTTVALGAAPAAAATPTPVLEKRVIGHSVKHRPIVAYHLGDPRIHRVSLILGQMHGDEHAGVTLVRSIINGRVSVEGLNLWVIPTMNPDGDARHTRQNAHHVDLNRNWPNHWKHLTGQYYSGRKALSEPETRAMYTFLRKTRPYYIVSLHQPLTGVDSLGGAAGRKLGTRLAHNLGLSKKSFQCWSTCYGSMTGWYEAHHYGVGETVEFGWHPSKSYLVGRARKGIIAALGGHFGSLAKHNPRSALSATAAAGTARLSGWAFDIDARATHIAITVSRDGSTVLRSHAAAAKPALDRRYHLTGGHAYALRLAVPAGRHTFCVVAKNIGAGTTAGTRRCVAVVGR